MPKMASFPSGRPFVPCVRDFPSGCGPRTSVAPQAPLPPCRIEERTDSGEKNPSPRANGILDVLLPLVLAEAEADKASAVVSAAESPMRLVEHSEEQGSQAAGLSEFATRNAEHPFADGGAPMGASNQLENLEQMAVDSIGLVAEQSRQVMRMEFDAKGRGIIYSKLYPPPKRRAVSAVRQFPAGCGPSEKMSIELKENVVQSIVANKACQANVVENKKYVVEQIENASGKAHLPENKDSMETEQVGSIEALRTEPQKIQPETAQPVVCETQVEQRMAMQETYLVKQSNRNHAASEVKSLPLSPKTKSLGIPKRHTTINLLEDGEKKKILTSAPRKRLEDQVIRQGNKNLQKDEKNSKSSSPEGIYHSPSKHMGKERKICANKLTTKLDKLPEDTGVAKRKSFDKPNDEIHPMSVQNLDTHLREIVHALMAAPNCPWRQGRKSCGSGSRSAVSKAKPTRDRTPPNTQFALIEINDEEDSSPQYEEVQRVAEIRESNELSLAMQHNVSPMRHVSMGRKSGASGSRSTVLKSKVSGDKTPPSKQLALIEITDEEDSSQHDVSSMRHIGKARKSVARSSRSNVSKSKVYGDNTPPSKQLALTEYKDLEESLPRNEEDERDLLEIQGFNELSVTIYPVAPSMHHTGNASKDGARHTVRRTLRLFQAICRKLLQGEEANSTDSKKLNIKGSKKGKRIDLTAASILKEQGQWVNTGKAIIGEVPGVEVGDEFQFRAELSIVGLHRSFQAGIDRVLKDGVYVATSVVASGGYQDDMDSSDAMIYSGSGGMPAGKDKPPEDQKLEGGNLALKNSISAKTPVRVIHGFKEPKSNQWSNDSKPKVVSTFTYAGLYLVEEYWQEKGPHGFIVYKFKLRRIPGQQELALQEVKRSKKSKVREGMCVNDISEGKEKIPIFAINTIDNELPAPFKYITKNKYPPWFVKIPPKGCDCTNGCSDSQKCACALKNGGEIPFNFNGAIVQAKPLVYECGPSCKCPPSCHNKVSQRGIRIPLEIFKTKTRGWGVRSLYSIPSGSFVCEYIGELLREKEAEQRSNDEYLFDIGHNYDDQSLWAGLPCLIPGLQSSSQSDTIHDPEEGFTIDAAECGSIGRFINHSCSPNLYAQNLLYDHDDKRVPHIMFFAAENIPPLQELTYHYNYTVDQVRDAEGNIKRKDCHCGSVDCCGRLY